MTKSRADAQQVPTVLANASLPPMAQQIADALAEEIVAGRHRPGQPLREQDLAIRFGTSRGPVREAFRILERERLVEILPWRGATVATLSLSEMANVFELQEALFALVARRCAIHGRDNEIREVYALVDDMKAIVAQGGSPDGHGARLTEWMIAMCGNDRAADVLRQLDRQTTWRYAHLDATDDRQRRQIVSSWRAMADALYARDPDTAESIAKRMVRQSRDIVLAALEGEVGPNDGAADARKKRRIDNE